jgi:hypothetical protein
MAPYTIGARKGGAYKLTGRRKRTSSRGNISIQQDLYAGCQAAASSSVGVPVTQFPELQNEIYGFKVTETTYRFDLLLITHTARHIGCS